MKRGNGVKASADTTDDAGGRSASGQRWPVTLAVMFAAQLASAVGFTISIPFLPLFVREVGATTDLVSVEMWAGVVLSAQAVAATIAAPVWGLVGDRWGRKPMVVRAMLGSAAVLFAMRFATGAEVLALLYGLQGLVGGTIPTSSALVAAAVPRSQLGRAMGALHTGHWLGLGAGPVIGGIVGDRYGFGTAFTVTAALLAASGLIVMVGVREVWSNTERLRDHGRRGRLWSLLAQRELRSTYAARFTSSLGRSTILPVVPLFVVTLVGSESEAGTYTGIVIGAASVAAILGAVFAGRAGDRYGHQRIVAVGGIAAALLFLPQGAVSTVWQLAALHALTGFAIGAVMPSLSALLALRTPSGAEGAVYGIDSSVMAAGRSLAPVLGAGLATSFGFTAAFAAAGAAFALAALILAVDGRRRQVPPRAGRTS